MSKKKLLYLSLNDGSDTRINKEIKSLSARFDITFLGLSKKEPDSVFIREYVRDLHIIVGPRSGLWTIIRYFFKACSLMFRSHDSVHLINEHLIFLLYPFLLFKRRVVLDIFDSIFLTNRFATKLSPLLAPLIYGVCNQVIVTDETRFKLLPAFVQKKALVLENYPYYTRENFNASPLVGPLKICFIGSLNRPRGVAFLLDLLKADESLRIETVGWLYDDMAKDLVKHPRVTYHGVLNQNQANFLASQCDYILSLYDPVVKNNIYASPNKIYDAIQTGTPLIINGEVLVSDYVLKNGLGVVISGFYNYEVPVVLKQLYDFRKRLSVDAALMKSYTWEAIESKLLVAHGSDA